MTTTTEQIKKNLNDLISDITLYIDSDDIRDNISSQHYLNLMNMMSNLYKTVNSSLDRVINNNNTILNQTQINRYKFYYRFYHNNLNYNCDYIVGNIYYNDEIMAFTIDCDWDERMTYEEDKIVELMNKYWIQNFDENTEEADRDIANYLFTEISTDYYGYDNYQDYLDYFGYDDNYYDYYN